MSFDPTNRGTLAKNARKSKDTDADITGSINIDGKEYWLNGWQKTNRSDNSTFYSLAVKPKQARQEAPPAPTYGDKSRRNIAPPTREPVPAFVVAGDAPDDDIPF